VIDYYRHPDWRESWGGAFNGQSHRQRMVEAVIRQLPIQAIVETGTYRGTTTAYLASLTRVPIYTVEFDPRCRGFAFSALRRFKNVRGYGCDSRQFLRMLASKPDLRDKVVLFYLDAHGIYLEGHRAEDVPLAEEVDLVFTHWSRALALIDDFQVPDDPGYTYDNFGPGKALTCGYIKPAIRTFGLHTFFPSANSANETGYKRGSVMLVADTNLTCILRTIPEIRELDSREL
jgi:hypothetical protein